MDTEIVEQHDRLLEELPEGVEHDEATCPVCIDKSKNLNEPDERGEMEKTMYDQNQLDAAVNTAVEAAKVEAEAPLRAELDALKSAGKEAEVAAQVAEVEAAAQEKIAELEAKVDLADAEAASAKKNYEDLVSFLEAAQAEAEEQAAFEARKIERAELVREKTAFSEEKIAERIEDWAKLSDEDFESRLNEWAELSEVAKTEEKEEAAVETANLGLNTLRPDTSKKESFFGAVKTVTAMAESKGISVESL